MNQLKKLLILKLLILVIQLKKTNYNTKINEIENKINDHDYAKFITTQELNRSTSDHFTARLAQAKLESKNDIANFVEETDSVDKIKNFT